MRWTADDSRSERKEDEIPCDDVGVLDSIERARSREGTNNDKNHDSTPSPLEQRRVTGVIPLLPPSLAPKPIRIPQFLAPLPLKPLKQKRIKRHHLALPRRTPRPRWMVRLVQHLLQEEEASSDDAVLDAAAGEESEAVYDVLAESSAFGGGEGVRKDGGEDDAGGD